MACTPLAVRACRASGPKVEGPRGGKLALHVSQSYLVRVTLPLGGWGCGAYIYTPTWISYVHPAFERTPLPGYLSQIHCGGWQSIVASKFVVRLEAEKLFTERGPK